MIGFRLRPGEWGGIENLTDEIQVTHDDHGVYVCLRGRPVLNIHEDEADLLAKVLPSHAEAVRRIREARRSAAEEEK